MTDTIDRTTEGRRRVDAPDATAPRRRLRTGVLTAGAAAAVAGALLIAASAGDGGDGPDARAGVPAPVASNVSSDLAGLTPDAASRWSASDPARTVAPSAYRGMSADAVTRWVE